MTEEKRHPIRVVVRRTGLTADLIRAWERRYGAVSPGRTATGRRLYSDEDIEKLRLVREATQHGRRVGDVGDLSLEALDALVREDVKAEDQVPFTEQRSASEQGAPANQRMPSESIERTSRPEIGEPALPSSVTSTLLNESLQAVRELDAARLDAILGRGLMSLGSTEFIESLIAPLMQTVGEQWEKGDLDTSSEHLATGVVRQMIARRLIWPAADSTAPLAVIATPAGQVHELGAILAASTAQSQGWRVLYLGADLPARDIARAASRVNATAVALSLVYPVDDLRMEAELTQLRSELPRETTILVGGPATRGYRDILSQVGAQIVADTAAFRSALGQLQAARRIETRST